MRESFTPKLTNLKVDIGATKLYTFNEPARLSAIDESQEVPHFKDVMAGMVKDLDSSVKAPDQILNDALVGNNADIHDVMIAMSKAEIGLNVATGITTKVIQAYEKVMSIQV